MADVEIIKESELEKQSVVLQHIVVQSIDRTPKDIKDLIDAVQASEMIFFPVRSYLYDIYSRFDLDGHYTGVWSKRKATILNKKLRFVKDGKKVDELDPLIKSEKFREFLKLILEQKAWGLSGAEFIPGPYFHFIPINRKHIKPESRVIASSQYDTNGLSYDGVWNLWVKGDVTDKGFMLACAICVLYRQGVFGDWAQFIEIFGQPFRIFRYDVWDEKTKKEAAELSKKAGGATSMSLPKQLDFEALDGKSSNGDGSLQDKFNTACKAEISTVVLGNTETTLSSKSSGHAQSEIHQEQQDEIIKDDLQDMQNALNDPQILRIIKSYGFPVDGGMFEYEAEVNLDALDKRKDIDLAVGKVVPIADDYYYDTYKIPKPDNYEDLKAQMIERQNAALNNQQQLPDRKKDKKIKPKNQAGKRYKKSFLKNLWAFFQEAQE
jgi:hypothetical protein